MIGKPKCSAVHKGGTRTDTGETVGFTPAGAVKTQYRCNKSAGHTGAHYNSKVGTFLK